MKYYVATGVKQTGKGTQDRVYESVWKDRAANAGEIIKFVYQDEYTP